MSAALESILEVLKQEADTQVRTEYENEIQRLRAVVADYQVELERTLTDLDNAVSDRDQMGQDLDALRKGLRDLLK